MSTINEQIVTGRAHRVLINKVAKLWQRISFWTKASDVEFNDGKTAETKVGAIKGITTDLNTTETGYAADMTALAQLNSDIQNQSFEKLSPGYYNSQTNVFYYSGSADFSYKDINITEEGLYRVILQGSIVIGDIVGPYITNSHGIVVVSAEGYTQNSGYEYASIEVPIWLTPDTYKLRTKSGTSRVWCILYKYVKN